MKEIKNLLVTVLSVSLLTSVNIGYNRNCNAMECKLIKDDNIIYNDKNVPIELKVGPNSPKEEVIDVLTELKNYLQLRISGESVNNKFWVQNTTDGIFCRTHYGVNNLRELITRAVGHDWLDALHRYDYKRICSCGTGLQIAFAGYFYTILRNSGFQSYVLNLSFRNTNGISTIVTVKLHGQWYCIPCDG